jgi:ubiquinone/menaquinone biosynthesis C-methylase UbiE
MPHKENSRSLLPGVAFYDAIAGDYDNYMAEDNGQVRLAVETKLDTYIKGKVVLDFGGGTGSDLYWLSRKYDVIFLEPSEKMRSIAKNKAGMGNNISFIERNIDFHDWSPGNLPFEEKADAILMNHAVLNCIKNISLLMERLDHISKPGTIVIAAVLQSSFGHYFRQGYFKTAFKTLFGKGLAYSNYKGMSHAAYLHTDRQVLKAIKPQFRQVEFSALPGTPYKILVLKKS